MLYDPPNAKTFFKVYYIQNYGFSFANYFHIVLAP